MSVSPATWGSIKVNGKIFTGNCGFSTGAVVNLEAVESGIYKFDHWGGSLSGSINPTKITMDSSKSVTAYFVLRAQAKNLQGAKDLIDGNKDIIVIDTSSTSNYANSHMLCARNYPWNTGSKSFDVGTANLNPYKEDNILLYDQTGSRSKAASDYLAAQGFLSIYYMTDGLDDWIAIGYETFMTAEDADICTTLPPMAYAGDDQTVNENVKVTLNGQGWDPDEGNVTYKWTQVQGTNVTLSSTTAAKPVFTSPILTSGDATLIFHLTVTDNEGDKDSDSVTVTVKWYNDPPTADAGSDQTVKPGDEVTLDGSGSFDPEGGNLSYSWMASSGTINPTLSSSTAVKPIFTAPSSEGWVVFTLTVTDSGNKTKSDTVKITVSSSGPGPTTLYTPTGLAANAVSYRKIMLRWTDQSPAKNSSFKIERKKKYCSDTTYNWTQIATVQSDDKAKNYEDIGDFEQGMKYSYRVRAYSGSDNSEYSNCASILYPMPSASTPSAPVNLVATYSSADTIDLSWDQWGSTVTKFEIYRDENDSGSWTLIATAESDVLSYSDETAYNNQTTSFYTYKVQACNAAGCSPPAYKVGVPFKPTGLTAGVNSQDKIVLQWTDNSDYERGFEIYRKTGSCDSSSSWEKVKQAGISRETVTAGSATSGTTYSYKIRAYYRSWGIPYVYGYSDWSECYEIVVP